MPIIANNASPPPPPASGLTGTAVQLPAKDQSLLNAQAQANRVNDAAFANPAGLDSVTTDGQTVTYQKPAEFIAANEYWKRQAALLGGRRRRVQAIRMDRF